MDETPAMSTATAVHLSLENGLSAPRVTEAEGLTVLQEEALLNEMYQTYVVENQCRSLNYESMRKFAIKIQLDDEFCRELGGVPFTEDEILASERLEDLCWIPDDEWLDDMKHSFKKAHESFLLTERSKEAAVSDLPEPVVRAIEKASPGKGKLVKTPSGKLSSRPKSGSAKKPSPRASSPKPPQSPKVGTPKKVSKASPAA